MDKSDWDKISKRYYSNILSPIKNCEENYLYDDLGNIEKSEEKKVIDLGCGIGEAEKFLSKNFKEVFAIDFSEGMIERAREKNKGLGNVSFSVMDMTNVNNNLEEDFDVALSVNSIITPNINDVKEIFKNIRKVLKKGGKFFCVLPSMEVYAYQSLLIADKELKKNKNIDEVNEIIGESIPDEEHDFKLGIVNFKGRQKNYYRFEILWRLKKAGFKNIQIKKIFYPWKEFVDAGQNYFPREDPPWDWYVICEK